MTDARKPEIDIAKGFAIFLVILGHVVTMHHTLFRWIFAFHMPVFFFLSGYTLRPERFSRLREFLRRKGKRLLLPYFAITLAAFLICMARPDYRQPILADGWRHQLLWIFYYAQPQNLYVGQIWFLAALFMAELIALLWLRCFSRRSVLAQCFGLLFLALLAVNIKWMFPLLPFGQRLPWKLDSALAASVFVLFGYYAAKASLPQRLIPLAPFLIPVSIWLSFFFGPMLSSYVNLCDCAYSPAPYYYSAALLGIAALVLTAWLSSVPSIFRLLKPFWRFWQFCGRFSLPIFTAQTFVIYFLTEQLARFTGIALTPMENMPGNLASLALSAAALALMLAVLYPWSRFQARRSRFARKR